MEITNGSKLGTAINLLSGFKPGWNPSDPKSSPFFEVPQPALAATPATIAGATRGRWADPSITLHDTAESVLSSAYDLRVVPENDEPRNSSYGSGALLIRGRCQKEALAVLRQELGIDFSVPDRGYALIEIRREAGVSAHSTLATGVYLAPGAGGFRQLGFRRTLSRLPAPKSWRRCQHD
jgi:hypothetical protein